MSATDCLTTIERALRVSIMEYTPVGSARLFRQARSAAAELAVVLTQLADQEIWHATRHPEHKRGQSYQEVADVLGVPLAVVKRSVHRHQKRTQASK